MVEPYEAAMIIIGNEILSGRTQDKNLNFVAKRLSDAGIVFAEVRVVRDIEGEIAGAVNELREKYDYVFTSGGIGPTHDDITSASIAAAFGRKLVQDGEAYRRLKEYYEGRDDKLNDARLKMTYVPEGAGLITNPVSAAPGFFIENVYVMAGIPSVMQLMFDEVLQTLPKGRQIYSRTLTSHIAEGDIAAGLQEINGRYASVDIGSYPSYPTRENPHFSVSIVLRSADKNELTAAHEEARKLLSL